MPNIQKAFSTHWDKCERSWIIIDNACDDNLRIRVQVYLTTKIAAGEFSTVLGVSQLNVLAYYEV